MSNVLSLFHIVFCTKGRMMTLPLEQCEHLYRFIWKRLEDMHCKLLRIGGIQNHVHMLVDIHPSIALSTMMQDIKSVSGGWLKKDDRFPCFIGWAKGYFATSISANGKNGVIEYIKGQRQHHLGISFENELRSLYDASGQKYDDEDLR